MQFGKYVQVRDEKFGTVIFETLREKVYVTNETGKEIINLIKDKKDAKTVAAELAVKYPCDPTVIERDVDEYLNCLRGNGIIA